MSKAERIHINSISNANDVGLLSLADLADVANDADYRVVGGHMVLLLTYVYPSDDAILRATSDADAGIEIPTAAGLDIHTALLARGYAAESGNNYTRLVGDGRRLSIYLLVPRYSSGNSMTISGRGFDRAPGLGFALAREPITVEVNARLQDGSRLEFGVPVPDVESALVLKLLAWKDRLAEKDLADIATLLEITHTHRAGFEIPWSLDSEVAKKGTRRDAAIAAHQLADMLDRQTLRPQPPASPRISALLRRHTRAF